MSRECMFLSSLSRHNKDLERQTLKPSASHSSRVLDSVIALRQICVTALFYLEDSRRIHPQSVRACQPKDLKRREWRSAWGREREGETEKERRHAGEKERQQALWLLLLYVFLPWACPVQVGLSQERCLFRLKSSLWSSDLPLTFLVF